MNLQDHLALQAVSMSKTAFKKEHVHLVKVLRKGSKQEQQKEADDQAKELDEVTSGGPGSGRHPLPEGMAQTYRSKIGSMNYKFNEQTGMFHPSWDKEKTAGLTPDRVKSSRDMKPLAPPKPKSVAVPTSLQDRVIQDFFRHQDKHKL
jgi:hypothetical protein